MELEPASADDFPQCLEARDNVTSFPARDDRLWLPNSCAELGLRYACAEPGLSDQIAAYHEGDYSTYML